MRFCKICNQPIYKNLSFCNLFKSNYIVHFECLNNLDFNDDKEAIPFEAKLIYYDYLFYQLKATYNYEYLETKYSYILYQRNLKNRNWSIIIYYEEGLFKQFNYHDFQILFSLSSLPVLIISVSYKNIAMMINLKR